MEFNFTLAVGIMVLLFGSVWVWIAYKEHTTFVREMARRVVIEGVVTREREVETYNAVTELSPHGVEHHPMVEYTVNKQRYIAAFKTNLNVGDKCLIAYDPKVPSDAILTVSYAHRQIWSGMVIVITGMTLITLGLLGYRVLG